MLNEKYQSKGWIISLLFVCWRVVEIVFQKFCKFPLLGFVTFLFAQKGDALWQNHSLQYTLFYLNIIINLINSLIL